MPCTHRPLADALPVYVALSDRVIYCPHDRESSAVVDIQYMNRAWCRMEVRLGKFDRYRLSRKLTLVPIFPAVHGVAGDAGALSGLGAANYPLPHGPNGGRSEGW